MRKHIHNPPLVIAFAVLFIFIFILKALLYSVAGEYLGVVVGALFTLFPENVSFSIFMGISYVFIFPIVWAMEMTGLNMITNNQFLSFLIDIILTIGYFTILYAIMRKLFFKTKKLTKNPRSRRMIE
jgi:hypothetical protein